MSTSTRTETSTAAGPRVDDLAGLVGGMMEQGAAAIKRTLESMAPPHP